MAKKADQNKLPCPECKEPVAFDATRCPHCQAVYSPEVIEQRKKIHEEGIKYGLFGCGIIALLMVVALAWCSTPQNIPEEPQQTAKADALAFYGKILSTVSACDSASGAVSAVDATSDPIESYNAVRRAADTCLGVPSDIGAIEVPASVGKKAHEALTQARDECENAYVSRWSAMSSLQEAFDGDGGIAALADASDAGERSRTGVIMCVTGIMTPLMDLGVSVDEMPGGDAS